MTTCRFCDHNVPLGTQLCPNCGAPVDTPSPQATADLEQQVRSLLGRGQKLEAVRLYKDQTTATLGEAKAAVDAIERGERATGPAEMDGDMEAELLRLLEGRQKIGAIKLYKERTGVQLSEAKQAVETLAARNGIVAQGGGCAGVLMAIVMAVAIAGATIW
jgi:ribosomal protein L7/L12